MIFVDADAYIAVNTEKDPHHRKAKELLSKLVETSEELVTSWQVVDEVTTKLSYFTTKKKSVSFLEDLLNSNTSIEYIDVSMPKSILRTFKNQTSKRVSLTDCTNMVIAKSLGIDIFFSFDNHYKKNGFKLLEEVV